MLQSIGMTNDQLLKTLVCEGISYRMALIKFRIPISAITPERAIPIVATTFIIFLNSFCSTSFVRYPFFWEACFPG